MKQQVVFFEGPSCVGKSTAVNTLLSKYGNIFHLNKDKIKWFISDYISGNEVHSSLIKSILLSMSKEALSRGMTLFIEGQKAIFDDISQQVKGTDIEIKTINIEAPIGVIEQRFHERIKESSEKGIKVSNTSVDRLRKLYKNHELNKYTSGITLDTSKLSKEEVILEIEKYIL